MKPLRKKMIDWMERKNYSASTSPTCLHMIAKYYGKSYSLPFQREKCYIDKAGVSLKGISESAEFIGLRTALGKASRF